jgi:hypothetical protein
LIDSSLSFLLLRIIHIIGFTIGLASSFALLVLYLIIRKNKNLVGIFKIMRFLIIVQIITNIFSSFSGIIRLDYSTVLENTSKTGIFYPKMIFFGVAFLLILVLFFWFSKLISILELQDYRNNHLSKNQDRISLFFLCVNVICLSLTFILGGSLAIF